MLMKFLSTLWQDIKKTVGNYSFVVCAIITVALCFTAQVYTNWETGKSYMVIDIIKEFSYEQMLENSSFSFTTVFALSTGGYLAMFLPIISAFPFIPNFCSERNSGLVRLTIFRTGKYRYYFSKFISAIIGGGLAVTLGYLVYAVIISFIFPMPMEYTPDPALVEAGIEKIATVKTVLVSVAKQLVGSFVFGAVSTVPAFFFASFIRNRYVITCLPFMITYMFTTAITKLSMNLWAENTTEAWDKANKIYSLQPSSLTSIVYSDQRKLMIAFYGGFTVISLVAFIVIMNLRVDKGE